MTAPLNVKYLPLRSLARELLTEIAQEHAVLIIEQADLAARKRRGDSIETGDLLRARDELSGQNWKADLGLMLAGILCGASVAGIVQNTFDGKPYYYFVGFGLLGILGVVAGTYGLRKRFGVI